MRKKISSERHRIERRRRAVRMQRVPRFNNDDAATGKKIVAPALVSKKPNEPLGEGGRGGINEGCPAGIIKLVAEKMSSHGGAVNRNDGGERGAIFEGEEK